MKRILFIILAIVLCLSLFSGCATKKEYCYVLGVAEDGFITNIDDLGRVFVKYENAQQHIKMFDTVVIKYNDVNLKETSGYIVVGKHKISYSYILEEVQSLRLSDPSKGEPLFD